MVTWGGLSELAAGSNTQNPHRERASNLTGACLHSSQLGKPDVSHPRQGSGILTAREGEGAAGRGCRKKRRPSCNREAAFAGPARAAHAHPVSALFGKR